MTQAEQLPSAVPVSEALLSLAATICWLERRDLTPGKGVHVYRWEPTKKEMFSEPIALDDVRLTADPCKDNTFKVLTGTFKIFGDDEMEATIKPDIKFKEDPFAQLVLEHFQKIYNPHHHRKCLREVRLRRQEVLRRQKIKDRLTQPTTPPTGFILTDNRYTK